MKRVPAKELEALPKDGLRRIDHYVYGLPKERPVKIVFADTFYWAALTAAADPAHFRSLEMSRSLAPVKNSND